MEDVGFLPTATTHLRKLRILGLWSLKLLWKKVLPHAIMVVRDEILFANLIDFPSFFKYFSGFLFAFASTGGWWSLVFLAALIRHVHAVLDHTPSPLGTLSHSPKSATKRSQRVSKRALLPSQESVAVATLVILSLTPIRMIQELSESLHINTLYMYCIKCVYIYIIDIVNPLALLLLTSAEHAEPFWSFPCSYTIFSAPLLEARFVSQECPTIVVWRPNFYLLDLPNTLNKSYDRWSKSGISRRTYKMQEGRDCIVLLTVLFVALRQRPYENLGSPLEWSWQGIS